MDLYEQFLMGYQERPNTGLVAPGNLNPLLAPPVRQSDGKYSSIVTASFVDDDGLETLIPTFFDGKRHTLDEAVKRYKTTGNHFGKFETPDAANAFDQKMHEVMEYDRIIKEDKAKEGRLKQLPTIK